MFLEQNLQGKKGLVNLFTSTVNKWNLFSQNEQQVAKELKEI